MRVCISCLAGHLKLNALWQIALLSTVTKVDLRCPPDVEKTTRLCDNRHPLYENLVENVDVQGCH